MILNRCDDNFKSEFFDFVRESTSGDRFNHLEMYLANNCGEGCESCKIKFLEIMRGILYEASNSCLKKAKSCWIEIESNSDAVSNQCRYLKNVQPTGPSIRPCIPDLLENMTNTMKQTDNKYIDDNQDDIILDMAALGGLDPMLRKYDEVTANNMNYFVDDKQDSKPNPPRRGPWPVDVTRSDPMYLSKQSPAEADEKSSNRFMESISSNKDEDQTKQWRCDQQTYNYGAGRRSSSNEAMYSYPYVNSAHMTPNTDSISRKIPNEDTEIFFPISGNDHASSPRHQDSLYRSMDWDMFDETFPEPPRGGHFDLNAKLMGYGVQHPLSASIPNIKRQTMNDGTFNYPSMGMCQDYSQLSYSYLLKHPEYLTSYMSPDKHIPRSTTIDSVTINGRPKKRDESKVKRDNTRNATTKQRPNRNSQSDSIYMEMTHEDKLQSLNNTNNLVIEQLNGVILDVLDEKTSRLEAKKTFHKCGTCKPCAFFHHPKKLCNDIRKCYFCHENEHRNSYLLMRAWKRRRQTIVQILPSNHANILTEINEDTSLIVPKDEMFYKQSEYTMAVRSLRLYMTNSIPRSIKPMHDRFLKPDIIVAVLDGKMDINDVSMDHMKDP